MGIASIGSLLDVLRQHRLLASERIAALMIEFQTRFAEARSLAKVLVQRGLMTVFQVNQVLQGRTAELVLGPYHILDRLGEGGVSQIYKARHAEHGWVVVLKVIRTELLSNPEAFRQFQEEMRVIAQLDHPNIVRFVDSGETGATHYFAMEYLEGTDLGKVVRLTGPLPAAQACTYVRQAALGLQLAHEHNLVHRDIKPVNLFLTQPAARAAYPFAPRPARRPKSIVKIIDWGLACRSRLRDAERGPRTSGAPALVGTADYVSPEQARRSDQVDIRADIYSLGCTFYYLLTGKVPFPATTVMQKLFHHQQSEPTPLASLRPDLPEGLAEIVKRMMVKKTDYRFQTPAALALALTPYCRADAPAAGQREPAARPLTERGRGGDPTPMPPATGQSLQSAIHLPKPPGKGERST
jgi:serine/threonine-protein kinase